ncbi:hypothetical protein [Pseudorhodoferax sp.]|uniref:hypothetical protein n=1 Tax=Pseudorhodoferax sp. TaxID=1993553 RepID=UPI0039E30CA3
MAQARQWMVAMAVLLAGGLQVGPAAAQPTPAQAAAAAGAGGSTSANGGAANLELGHPSGSGAIVGPRARRQAQELLGERPDLAASAPRNPGERALLLERAQQPLPPASAPAN